MLKSIIIALAVSLCMKFSIEIITATVILMFIRFRTHNMKYNMLAVDNLSLNLSLLTAFVIIVCILTNSILTKNKIYHLNILILFLFLVSSFLARSLLAFFILFETSLIPLFLLILGWGYQPERLQSSLYFLFYTLLGSLPLLINILFLNKIYPSLNWFIKIDRFDFIIYICIITAFIIKMPMFLTHLWLPKAHVEAPTVGSMILAGVTLKLGRYALLRLFYLNNNYIIKYNWIWISISLVGNILLCFICTRQTDLKSLIAYSSVVHMGLCLITILFMFNWSFEGGLWLSLSHGMASSGLFFLTNSLYTRLNRRRLFINKGLSLAVPTMGLWWFLLIIFNMASPPSLNLFREIKMIVASIPQSTFIVIIATLSRFICAVYCLFMYANIQHGKQTNNQKFSSSFTTSEHLTRLYHVMPLALSILFLFFIQWIIYFCSLIKIMICGIIDSRRSLI